MWSLSSTTPSGSRSLKALRRSRTLSYLVLLAVSLASYIAIVMWIPAFVSLLLATVAAAGWCWCLDRRQV